MNSDTSTFHADASGTAPKQTEYIPFLKLNDGHEIPMLGYGLGTARFKRGNADKLDENIINDTVTAIKNGYYHLDGAEAYGNEAELGAAIARSGVDRSKLFITTKTSCRAGETVETAFARSLAKLGVDYVDLYLIHSPFWARSPAELQQKWAEMEAVRASGRARSVGVSNYLREHLEATLQTPGSAGPPAVNQIEYHPYLQHDPDGLLAYHRDKGIALQAYSPLTAVTKAAPGPVDPVYERLAEKYGVTPGEVALRWCLDQGIVAITTSSNEERLRTWMQRLPLFKLTPKEVGEIAEKGREKHFRGFWGKEFAEDDRR
ncbi:NADP-dependent oxidoreductase domain-containing protein [Chaetomium fimeti]|jgi:diketogulonate reductase-like aldo/keto reductase|uniref:NADP-dependent oxidoreductase domain-containing protein n=1 Tax=Chaetomium fimeti TaxID=1854472 RepID=A0AAE0HBH7_9PEZI|nr:NADP-dependent oxidoreductase domain-containing protein [Chaetomium fimeti]